MTLYERMDGSMFVIGVRYNRFHETGCVGFMNSLGFFFGKNYKVFQWITPPVIIKKAN
jgi:hypothetical protein